TSGADWLSEGHITGKKIGFFTTLNSPASTTVTTAGTFTPIQGFTS
ncbi:unnamed protein product, partial [marine sediment metagenome]